MAVVSGFVNSLSMLKEELGVQGKQGLAKTEEAAAGTERIPLPPWLSLAPQPGPTRPGKGELPGGRAASLGRGQVRGSASQGLCLGPRRKDRAGPGEQVS